MFFCLNSYIQGITCECWYIHILKGGGVGSENTSQSSVLQSASRWEHAGLKPCPERGITPGGSNALVSLVPVDSHDCAKQEEL